MSRVSSVGIRFLIPGYLIAVLKAPALFGSKLTGHDVSGWSSEVHNSSPCALNLGCILVGRENQSSSLLVGISLLLCGSSIEFVSTSIFGESLFPELVCLPGVLKVTTFTGLSIKKNSEEKEK